MPSAPPCEWRSRRRGGRTRAAHSDSLPQVRSRAIVPGIVLLKCLNFDRFCPTSSTFLVSKCYTGTFRQHRAETKVPNVRLTGTNIKNGQRQCSPRPTNPTSISRRRNVAPCFRSSHLRQRSNDHPVVMFSAIAAAAFVWTRSRRTRRRPSLRLPPAGQDRLATQTTAKTSRLPISDVDRACAGQSWGGKSAVCLAEIAARAARPISRSRMIADAAPAGLDTPNIF